MGNTTNFLKKIIVGALSAGLLAIATTVQAGVTVTYYHNDALGSPVSATDKNKKVIWRQHYRPYGEPTPSNAQAASDSIGYAGHVHDTETGLTYMGARYYDPHVGRFMGIDPVGFSEPNIHSFNRYAYANNNPYRYIDPDGESAVTAFGGLLVESGRFLTGNGFNGSAVLGALADGYNGEGGGVAAAAFEDATSFIPAGLIAGGLIKLSRLAKVATTGARTKGTTVIGHLPDYPKVAEKMGANYLKPSKNWTPRKQGEFIKDVISRGDDVFIGSKIRQGPSVLKKEIKQLVKQGYRTKAPGSKWLIKD